MELWRPVGGFEGAYEVSYVGDVRSLSRTTKRTDGRPLRITGRVLRPHLGSRGYYKVTLNFDGRSRTESVHALVARAFLPKPPRRAGTHREGFVVNHKDGDKLNNHVANLEYVPSLANLRHARAAGLLSAKGTNNHKAKLTDDDVRAIRLAYSLGHKQTALAEIYGVNQTTISGVVTRKTWPHVV